MIGPLTWGISGEFGLGFGGTLLVGLIFGLIGGLIVGLIFGLSGGLIGGLSSGLGGGLIVGLIGGLFEGLGEQETKVRSIPNQSIRRASRNAFAFLIVGALGGCIFALVLWRLNGQLTLPWFGTIYNLAYFRFGGDLKAALLQGIPVGIGISLGISFTYGIETVIRHYTLRWLLARQAILPYPFADHRLAAYLDTMVARILLRRVGGGWVFIHRYLLEYFASLHPAYQPGDES